ncbi:aldo/keto reductase family oxidoreductase [Corallococcus coralloides DSM 2259]|uniref:Aldo/keto reductase family oxidoreductase n=1 Tax=Corallococcus coralloides (strain ATCC 25202 / DSM 2259 / NBRC 100086 / M2) TaxID=1144275 RepID=H8MIG8_CORCM|nr:aldo/keto reductase [Corallococcus coralloides]AFE09139.1 aldo/keto reductase family oxidoreductase [Corallococcus coralloides DSM 2259]
MTPTHRTTQLGTTGPRVFPIALGCMSMSGAYGPSDETESIATLREAIERGVTLLDTADFYASGHNELLIRRAIEGQRDKVRLSVKFGAMRGPDGAPGGFDARPAAVKNFITYSLQRLGVDHIDVYRPARLDPTVPIEDTVGAIADLVKGGYVRSIGLSEVGAETIRRAAKVHPLSDLQIEYSLITRKPEKTLFPTLTELGMSATLYGVLSRGLLTGAKVEGARVHYPRFAGEAGQRNAAAVARFHAYAAERGMTPAQLSVAWVLAKQPAFVPVVGARTRKQLLDVLGALEKPLSSDDVAAVEAILPKEAIAGTRYPEQQMKMLDSER